MSVFLTKEKQKLKAYTPGEQPKIGQFIKLNTNENPFPPPVKATDFVSQIAKNCHFYNDMNCTRLTEVFSKYYGVEKENVIFSNGSDEILAFCCQAYCDSEKGIRFPNISYGFYNVFANLYEIKSVQIPLEYDFTIKISDYFNSSETVLITNPNAPTGIALTADEIEQIVVNNPDNIVIIDEAYIDFGGETVAHLTKKHKNLIVIGTFSKSRSMAGARLGYAIADKELISDLNRIKFSFNPYSVNAMTQELGAISIEEDDYFKDSISKIISVREDFVAELDELSFITLPSKANFVFTKHPKISGEEIYNRLKDDKILVRHFKDDLISDFVRISIGTKSEMETLINSLKGIVSIK